MILEGNIAYLNKSGTSVWFSDVSYGAFSAAGGSSSHKRKRKPEEDEANATYVRMSEILTDLKVVPWGEDNRFPQNITKQLDYCGVAKSALNFKAKALYGNRLYYGKITAIDEKGNETFVPAMKGEYPEVDKFWEDNGNLSRYFLEFNQDWVQFANCFPELITNNKRDKIVRIVHQESCDCRYMQEPKGRTWPEYVYLSKKWGEDNDQYVRFDKDKGMKVRTAPDKLPEYFDNDIIKQVRCLDPYDSLADLTTGVENGITNFIFPVNYPSPNKTYYQLAYWDGARLSGWLEIAAKIPALLKSLYKNAFNIKYHVEIPEQYWERRFGAEAWNGMKADERTSARMTLLQEMDNFLSGAENAYKTFVSFFDIDRIKGDEVGRIKITVIDNKSTVDKDIIASSAANSEILFAMQINPDLIGAGAPGGPYSGSAGSGSNIREAWLVYLALLQLERDALLEPLYLIKRFNGWPDELEFRFFNTVLTTLNQGKGTEKVLS